MRDLQIEIRDFDTIPMVPCHPREMRRRAQVQRVLRRPVMGSLFWWFLGAAAIVTIGLSAMCQETPERASVRARPSAAHR